MPHPFQPTTKPPLPWPIEGLFLFLLALCIAIAFTGCRGVEYTASAAATHEDGPDCYTARVEVTSTNWALAN